MNPEKREILKLLGDRWEEKPEMSFGRLLVSLGIAADNSHNWNIEDKVVLERVRESVRR